MPVLRVLIVDDEPLIRSGIRMVLSRLPGVEVAGECGDGASAVRFLQTRVVDLVLLDIRLPDSSGLDVVQQVGPDHMPLVTFVTAYDEYAVRAFELNAIDYLLKPFDEDRLVASIDRARERLASRNQSALPDQLRALLETKRHPDRFAIRNADGYELVAVDSVDWIESADNYVELHCGAKTYLMTASMSGMEEQLDPARFTRVHRCRIVNVSRIVKVHFLANGAYELELRGGVRLTTGRQYKHIIQSLVGRAAGA